MKEQDCHICGTCWWVDCPNDADYVMREVEVKRHKLPVYTGDIELCSGHAEVATRERRLDLNWLALEQALALKGPARIEI